MATITKSEVIRTRVTPKLKKSIEAVFKKLDISTSEAINMFLNQVAAQKSIPIDMHIPNKKTRKAIQDVRSKKGLKESSLEELMREFK